MTDDSLPTADRFVVRRVLGEGGFGRVFEVYDRMRGRVLALKRLKVSDPGAIVRFKRESRVLHELGHPNLVTVYDLFADEEGLCFTMERIDGTDFVRWVRGDDALDAPTTRGADRTFDVSRLSPVTPAGEPVLVDPVQRPPGGTAPDSEGLGRFVDALAQVARALEAIHGADRVHRDIKGPNVLVDRAGRVVVLDFGVVGSVAEADTGYAGTPDYMAPEAEDGHPQPASDLYALGVMAYVALSGHLPYLGTHAQKRLLRRTAPPDPLPEGVPEPLRRLVLDLLAPDPAHRPTPAEVLGRLGAAARPDETDPGRGARLFVARDAHLARLRAAADAVARGAPHVVTVVGPSGAGKTSLVERFLGERLRLDPSTLVLRGACYDRETLPYKALDVVVDALATRAARPDVRGALGRPPEAVAALGAVFPLLGRALGWDGVPPPPGDATRRLALHTLRALLGLLATRGPVVLFVDDLHGGDRESASLLVDLLDGPEAPSVLVLLAWREEDVAPGGFVAALAPLRAARTTLRVAELGPDDARGLAVQLLGGVPADADALVRESGGNPALLVELVEHARDRIENRTRQVADTRRVLDDAVASRVAGLDAPSRAVLEVVALAGRPLPVRVLTRAADLPEADLLDEVMLGALRRRRLLRTYEVTGRTWVDAWHPRVREAIGARLDAAREVEVHGRLAEAWEAWGEADDETVARHHEAAGAVARAHALFVAAAARARGDDARAVGLLRRAVATARAAGLPAGPSEDALADVLVRLGLHAEAADVLAGRADEGDAGVRRERALRVAEQRLRAGHLAAAEPQLASLLPAYGLTWPASRFGVVRALVSERLRLWLRGTSVARIRGDGPPAAVRRRLVLLRELVAGLRVAAPAEGFVFQSRYLREALDSGLPEHVATALAMEAAFLAAAGPSARGRCEALLADAARRACDTEDPTVAATVELARSGVALLSGEHAAARRLAEAADARLRDHGVGTAPLADLVVTYLHTALWFLGDLRALDERTRAARADAARRDDALVGSMLEVGHHATLTLFLDDRPDLVPGRVAAATAGWSHDRFHVPAMLGARALAEARLYAGQGTLAHAELLRSWDGLARGGTLRSELGGVAAWELRARVETAAAAAASGRERARLLDDARASVVEVLRYGAAWAAGLARLAEAGIAAVVGDRPATLERLRLAEPLLAGADLALHADVAQLHLAELHGDTLLRASAVDALRQRGIRRPEAAARCLAPGLADR